MPRILTGAGILVALLAPSLAFAAATDVTLVTDTVLSVGGITLNISGSNAAVESITVNSDNFSVVLKSGSSFQVSAPGLQRINADVTTGQTNYICDSSQSLIKYAPDTTVTVTISPSADLCSASGDGSSVTGGSTSSNTPSPGGGSATPSAPAAPATPATPATPETPAIPATPATPASGLSSEQATAILSLLASFGADSATIANVQAVLLGTGSASASAPSSGSFTRDLEVGVANGSDVKALQMFLNAHGYTIANSGAGSPGNETTKFGVLTRAALIKYQKAKGITPAAGYFGKKTRAAISAE